MSADLQLHIETDNITEEHFRCFFSSVLGSPSMGYECQEKRDARMAFQKLCDERKRKFPGTNGLLEDKWPKKAKEWYQKKYVAYMKAYPISCSHHRDISATPSVWIGEVSWLKAALFNDDDTFIPDPVEKISELVADKPIITDKLIRAIGNALKLDNKTQYKVAEADNVTKFLRGHKGKRVFSISW